MTFAWIPEAPIYRGLYAPKDYEAGINTATFSVWEAMRFDTQAECQHWCDNNPAPAFEPVEHGFF